MAFRQSWAPTDIACTVLLQRHLYILFQELPILILHLLNHMHTKIVHG